MAHKRRSEKVFCDGCGRWVVPVELALWDARREESLLRLVCPECSETLEADDDGDDVETAVGWDRLPY